MSPPVHAAVDRMVEHDDRFTFPPPADHALLALHSDGIITLIAAARSGAVEGGLASLRSLLIQMLQLSKYGLDVERINTVAYVEDRPLTAFERFIRVRLPSPLCPGPTPHLSAAALTTFVWAVDALSAAIHWTLLSRLSHSSPGATEC